MKIQNQFQLLAMCGISCSLSQILSAYDLHEWGTFTTVSGSDGRLLTGLQVEEEHLPSFVYSHLGMEPRLPNQYLLGSYAGKLAENKNQISVIVDQKKVVHPIMNFKGIPQALLSNVTVKMETPVIYFYGDDTPKVNVKVGFKGGTISQWYPQRKSGDTPNKFEKGELKLSDNLQKIIGDREMVKMSQMIDFSKAYNGAIEWDVEILPKSESDPAFTFKADENTTWIYPRVPDANMIKVGDEFEDFLFYRGIGNFDLPAIFSVSEDETVSVKNNSDEAIPFAFAFENIEGKFRYKIIGSIAKGGVGKVSEREWKTPSKSRMQVEVFQEMRKGLVAQGLTKDEANGMIKTWWKSYFNKPGLRVFWVVPQTDIEKILPLEVDPKPANQVRVLVGRADIMRPSFEKQMIADLGTHEFNKYYNDRFYPSYLARLKKLVTKPVFQKFDVKNLSGSHMTITAKKGSSEQGEGVSLYAGNEVKLQHLKLAGSWEITAENKLRIGDAHFTLNPETGILTAEATIDADYDTYEIQLPRVLN